MPVYPVHRRAIGLDLRSSVAQTFLSAFLRCFPKHAQTGMSAPPLSGLLRNDAGRGQYAR